MSLDDCIPKRHSPHCNRLYIHAKVGHGGLGNLLIPWARAEILRYNTGLPMLAPQWVKPHVGPILRHENDQRHYIGTFSTSGYVTGIERSIVRTIAREATEDAPLDLATSDAAHHFARPIRIVFSGLRDYFTPLLPYRRHLRSRFADLLTARVIREALSEPIDHIIGVHMRRGDMGIAATQRAMSAKSPPASWFINCVHSLRNLLGGDVPVRVYSDGTASELSEIVRLPNVERASRKSAAADILALSRSPILIGTGASTFSRWAAFLGEMPSFWYPGTSPGVSSSYSAPELETEVTGHIPAEVPARTVALLRERAQKLR